MAKIKLRAGKDAVTQAQSGEGDWGEPPRPGLYHFRLDALDKRDNKDGDGQHLSLRWRPVGIGREGTKPEDKLGSVWDRVSLTSEAAEWVRARLAIALGAKPNRSGAVILDIELDATKPGSPIGTVVLGRVKGGKDLEGDYRPEMGWIGPLEATPENEEEGGFSDDEDEVDEEEASSPFDEDEAEPEGDLLTREQLENMENKELGGVAKDFDINTKQYAKKVKGKVQPDRAGLIDAILEAQGGEEEPSEDDDEDPF